MRTRIETPRTAAPAARDIGLTGQLVIGGMVSTGLLMGGYTVGLLGLIGRTSGHAILATSLGLFVAGAAIGLVVAALLGLAGRDEGVTLDRAAIQAARGALYAVSALALGALLAGWIAMSVVSAYLGKVAPLAGSAVAAMIAGAIILATTRLAWESVVNATRRARRAA
jgi:hypothetical protein